MKPALALCSLQTLTAAGGMRPPLARRKAGPDLTYFESLPSTRDLLERRGRLKAAGL